MLLRRSAFLTATFTCVALALPAFASAKDYCFGPVPGCTPAAYDDSQLQLALDEAESNGTDDRFFLVPPAEFANGPFIYQSAERIEIIGAGTGQTILTAQPGQHGDVLRVAGGAGSSVHDLTIRLPESAANGLTGLSTANTARRIEVVEHPTQAKLNSRNGVELENGGTLEDSSVTLDSAQTTYAVRMDSGAGTVRRSVLNGHNGVTSAGGMIERSRVTASDTGVDALRSLTAIAGSVIRITDTHGVGIWAGSQSLGSDAAVSGDGVTIVGPGLPETLGASASTFVRPAQNAEINLTNSIIRGFSSALDASTPAVGAGKAKVAASYSDYDPGGNSTFGPNASVSEANVSNVGDVGFVDAAGGNYRLLPGSPLIDAGDPTGQQGFDLDGNPLVADGNGDGIGRRDPGAFELQPVPKAGSDAQGGGGQQGGAAVPDMQAPLVSGFRALPARFTVARAGTPLAARLARGTRFRYVLDEPARVRLTLQRVMPGRRAGGKCVRPSPRLRRAKRCSRHRTIGVLSSSARSGANSAKFSGRLGKRALRPGRYRAVITATDAAGNRSAARTARFRVVGS